MNSNDILNAIRDLEPEPEKRGWEERLLRDLNNPELHTEVLESILEEHTNRIQALELRPSFIGNILAAALGGALVFLWLRK